MGNPMGVVLIISGVLIIFTGFFIIFRNILWQEIAGGIFLILGLLMAMAGLIMTLIPGFFK